MGPACCTACVLSSWSSLDDMQPDEAAHKIISAVAVVERFTFIQAPSLRNRDGIAVLATGAATWWRQRPSSKGRARRAKAQGHEIA
jgi:hypothetical protein